MEASQEKTTTGLLQDIGAKAKEREHAMGQLAAAYVEAMGQIENVVKNANNPHFGSNYADLGAVLDTVKPVFYANGLALLQSPGVMNGDKISLTWVLWHKSGQNISGTTELPIGPKATAQAAGSALTYARRYQAAAVGGIAQVDDDGNHASSEPREPKKPTKPKASEKTETAAGEETYADKKARIIAGLKKALTLADLKTVRSEVEAIGDSDVANAYVAQRDMIKKAAEEEKS